MLDEPAASPALLIASAEITCETLPAEPSSAGTPWLDQRTALTPANATAERADDRRPRRSPRSAAAAVPGASDSSGTSPPLSLYRNARVSVALANSVPTTRPASLMPLATLSVKPSTVPMSTT